MKLSIIKKAGVVIAVSPFEDEIGTTRGKSVDGRATLTGIAPLPGQELFTLDAPDDVAHRLFAADSSENVEELLRSYPLAKD